MSLYFFSFYLFIFFFLLFSKSLFERYLLDWVPFNLGRSLVFRAHIEGGPSGAAPFVRKKNALFFCFCLFLSFHRRIWALVS